MRVIMQQKHFRLLSLFLVVLCIYLSLITTTTEAAAAGIELNNYESNNIDENSWDWSSWSNEIDDDEDYDPLASPLRSYDDENDSSDEKTATKYEPTWESLDSRPLPSWYDKAKIGIFIHWGVFSVPAYGGAWFWHSWRTNNSAVVKYMKDNYPPSFTYQDFGPQFTAQFYNAEEWVKLFEQAGAKYVVLTAKHHEGFTNWPSKYSFGWNSMDIGPKKDLVGELAKAVKNSKSGMKFGLYHSLYEFYNPLYLADKASGYKTKDFVNFKTLPELYELVNNYEPEVIWSDGNWEASGEYWSSKEFLAWLYNESPVKDTVVVNDRWGNETMCKHGDFYNCQDHFNPHKLQTHKWENAFTTDKEAWAYRIVANFGDFHSIIELINEVVTTVSCGGNVLLNVGPTKEGTIIPIMQERLLQLGSWLSTIGEAIYSTTPWLIAQNDTTSGFVWYTLKPSEMKLYAIVLRDWNTFRLHHEQITLGSIKINSIKAIASISLVGYSGALKWEKDESGQGIIVHLPNFEQFFTPMKVNYGWALVINYNTSFMAKKMI